MYGFSVKFRGSFASAVERTTDELKKEGFGVLTRMDVMATMKEMLGEVAPLAEEVHARMVRVSEGVAAA